MSLLTSLNANRLTQISPTFRNAHVALRISLDSGTSAWADGEGAILAGGECLAFARWVDGLPARGNAAIKELRECGFAFDLDALEAQLRRALDNPGGEPAARSVGRRLLNLLGRRGNACRMLVDPLP